MEEGEGVPEFSDESVFRAASFRRALAAPKMSLPSGFFEILRAARYAISLRLLSIQLLAFAPGYLLYLIFFALAGQARPVAPLELSPWLEILAHTLALSLLFSAAWVLAYPLAVINGGLALTYLVLRRIKDGENFLERCQADESTPP
jgi:hypothetical protein